MFYLSIALQSFLIGRALSFQISSDGPDMFAVFLACSISSRLMSSGWNPFAFTQLSIAGSSNLISAREALPKALLRTVPTYCNQHKGSCLECVMAPQQIIRDYLHPRAMLQITHSCASVPLAPKEVPK